MRDGQKSRRGLALACRGVRWGGTDRVQSAKEGGGRPSGMGSLHPRVYTLKRAFSPGDDAPPMMSAAGPAGGEFFRLRRADKKAALKPYASACPLCKSPPCDKI